MDSTACGRRQYDIVIIDGDDRHRQAQEVLLNPPTRTEIPMNAPAIPQGDTQAIRNLDATEIDTVSGGIRDKKDVVDAVLVFGSGALFPFVGIAGPAASVYFWLKS